MRKRKNTGRLLSILLCLVMVFGMLPTTALADEPQLEGDPIPDISFSVMKKDDNGSPLKGAHFELIPIQGTNGEGKFAYSDENGIATFDTNINPGTYKLVETEAPFGYLPSSYQYIVTVLQEPNGEGKILGIMPYVTGPVNIPIVWHTNGATIATFFNKPVEKVEISLSIEKTVVQGGNVAPGSETFTFELLMGVGEDQDRTPLYRLLDTAEITTNGTGTKEHTLKFTIPEDLNSQDGFGRNYIYLRERAGSAANWTYDDAVWHIKPQYEQTGGLIVDPPLVNVPSGNVPLEETGPEYRLVIHATKRMESDNGVYYVDSEIPTEKMTFTNTYTRSSGGGGGSTGAAITANKTDAQGKALAGATFVLEDSRGREAYQATSNTSGTVRFTDVSSGTYTLLEKKAPEGYALSNETYTLTVSGSRVTMNGKAYSPVTFVNRRAAELNRTDHFAFLVGYTDGTFGSERNMTRAEVTTMFARLLTEQIEADKTYSNNFSDVPKGYWAANYIGYMQQFGIITGYSDGSFRPDAPVTRAEFAAIASRFEKLTEGSKSFADVPDTYWAARYISFAATRGWVTGYSDGTFKPENTITRAEVAAVTCRLLERSADQNYIRSHLNELRTFSDMTESHWAYWYAMEAANGHDYTKSGGSENWNRTYR